MRIQLNHHSGEPIYTQIVEAIKYAVAVINLTRPAGGTCWTHADSQPFTVNRIDTHADREMESANCSGTAMRVFQGNEFPANLGDLVPRRLKGVQICGGCSPDAVRNELAVCLLVR